MKCSYNFYKQLTANIDYLYSILIIFIVLMKTLNLHFIALRRHKND